MRKASKNLVILCSPASSLDYGSCHGVWSPEKQPKLRQKHKAGFTVVSIVSRIEQERSVAKVGIRMDSRIYGGLRSDPLSQDSTL